MSDQAWESMSPEDRLKYIANSGGPSGNFVNSMEASRQQHPDWGGTNYFDKVLNSMATGSSKMIPEANVPGAKSMIGMMSGDAGADIADAKAAAGPNPLEDYVPPAYKTDHPGWGGTQEQRYQDYQTTVGKNLAGITGADTPYDPTGGGGEQNAIQGGMTPDQIARRAAWLKQMAAVRGGA